MERKHINTDNVFNHPAYTGIVSVSRPGTFHFFAGRTPTDENYKCVAPGDLVAQYRQCMDLLTKELEAVGATWDDVVFRRIYTLDVDGFIAASEAAAVQGDGGGESVSGYINPDKMPPSTLIGVTRLSDPEFLIEIEILAITEH